MGQTIGDCFTGGENGTSGCYRCASPWPRQPSSCAPPPQHPPGRRPPAVQYCGQWKPDRGWHDHQPLYRAALLPRLCAVARQVRRRRRRRRRPPELACSSGRGPMPRALSAPTCPPACLLHRAASASTSAAWCRPRCCPASARRRCAWVATGSCGAGSSPCSPCLTESCWRRLGSTRWWVVPGGGWVVQALVAAWGREECLGRH